MYRTTFLVASLGAAVPAFAVQHVAEGPNAMVPAGAPLPELTARCDTACDNLGECGSICPSPATVFIGDFAYDQANNRFAVIEVVNPDGIFWMDADDCTIGLHGTFSGVSQRGCGYDNDTGIVYSASWNDNMIWWLDDEFNVLGNAQFGEGYAGLAVDETNRLLYATTNSYVDELIEYNIQGNGAVAPTGNRWIVPWRGFSNGYSTASLEYDDCSKTFMMINQDANTMEYFQLQGGNLVNISYCALPLGVGWGFGLNAESVELKVADVSSLACFFPIISVEPEEIICGGGAVPDLRIAYQSLSSKFVGSGGGPIGVSVHNNTSGILEKVLWMNIAHRLTVPLGNPASFPPGVSTFYAGVEDQGVRVPAGEFPAQILIGDEFLGPADDTTDILLEVVVPGIQ